MQSGARGRQARCAFRQLLLKARENIAARGGPDPNYGKRPPDAPPEEYYGKRPPDAASDGDSAPVRRIGQSVY